MAGRVAGRAFAHGAQAPWVGRVSREGARVRSLGPGAHCSRRLSRGSRVGKKNGGGARSGARDLGRVRCALRDGAAAVSARGRVCALWEALTEGLPTPFVHWTFQRDVFRWECCHNI